jgi:O-antigen/teichoic acid export membrane protein
VNKTLLNILSNVLSRIWSIGIGLAMIPIYTSILGMEAYGLVGFYATLIGSLAILDLGLSATLSRELARSMALKTPSEKLQNLVYSLEGIYWCFAIILSVLIILFAPVIANHWVKAEKLNTEQITNSIMLMGGIIAFQWPQSIYNGGLMGLQQLVPLNIASTIWNTIKSIGVVFVLKFISAQIEIFFLWQILTTAFMTFTLRYLLWKKLPKSDSKPTFSILEIKNIWKFAAGMTGISLATFCLSQIDKIVLSKILTLKEYGFYIISWAVGTSILLGTNILGAIILPKITETVALGDNQLILSNYHRYNRLIASIVAPLGILLCFFSYDIIFLWTQNRETSLSIWLAVSILSAGSLFNSFMHLPYYLMLAYGNTKFTIYQNIVASILLTPLLFWWTDKWGITGATLVWLFVNLGYNIISLPLIYRNSLVLKGELVKTYIYDIGIAFSISIIVIGFAKFISLSTLNIRMRICILVLSLLMTYIIILYASKDYRKILISFCKKQTFFSKI